MGENFDNYSYNNATDSFEWKLASEIQEVLKDVPELLNKQWEQVIKSLDNKKLADYIEKSFKTNEWWLTYSEMKNHAWLKQLLIC